jgi:hypothetical protein
MLVVKAWKEQVIIAAGRGFPLVTCAHSAKVTPSQIMRELGMDPAFKERYEEAKRNAPPPPRW